MPGTHREVHPCHGIITNHFCKNDFGPNLEYVLGTTNLSAKPTSLKMVVFLSFYGFMFSFVISYTCNALIEKAELQFLREKVP